MQASLLIKELTFDEIQKVAGGSASGTFKRNLVPSESFRRFVERFTLPIWRGGVVHGAIPLRLNSAN